MQKISRRSFIRSVLALGLTMPGMSSAEVLSFDEEEVDPAIGQATLTIEYHGNLCVASQHLPQAHRTRWHAYGITQSDLMQRGEIEDLAKNVTVIRKYIARASEGMLKSLGLEDLELYDAGYDVNSEKALAIFLRHLSTERYCELGQDVANHMKQPPDEESYGSWEIDDYGGEMIEEADEWTWARSLFIDGPLSPFVEELEIDLDGDGTFPGQAVSMGCTVEQANLIVRKYNLPVLFVNGT